jgi:hypothetical protein
VPDRLRSFVRLKLSADDRLIPEADLQRTVGDSEPV